MVTRSERGGGWEGGGFLLSTLAMTLEFHSNYKKQNQVEYEWWRGGSNREAQAAHFTAAAKCQSEQMWGHHPPPPCLLLLSLQLNSLAWSPLISHVPHQAQVLNLLAICMQTSRREGIVATQGVPPGTRRCPCDMQLMTRKCRYFASKFSKHIAVLPSICMGEEVISLFYSWHLKNVCSCVLHSPCLSL